MLFNSIDFAIFLPIVFILYWFVTNKNLRCQNVLLIIASYVFYGWWDWRFLSLIFISSAIDFSVGLGIAKYSKRTTRKLLLLVSILINIGLLGFFKYYNFFTQSFADAFTFFGAQINSSRIRIILPVGISFYTFQTLSYSIDIYRRKLKPTRDIFSFFAFVSFFPQLVAGPIERASNLLPQFYIKRIFDISKATDGLRQILWGIFKKVVIADNCAIYVNEIFSNYTDYSGSTLFLGGVFFAFQIYGDFSGYSDIAIGTARLFGFNLMKNFAFPYFSRDIAEFWRRWHISLSTWFRDYVYIPLGGSHGGTLMKIRNVFIIFLVSGLWHGANWTFIIWGGVNALYFLPLLLLKKNRINTNLVAEGKIFPNIKELMQILMTFFITVIAWIFFRSENVEMAWLYLERTFTLSFFSIPQKRPLFLFCLLAIFILIEWLQRSNPHALYLDNLRIPILARWSTYLTIVFVIFWFGVNQQEFIYFQF